MKTKEYAMLRLFEGFIAASKKGKRLKPDGTLLKKKSVENYYYVKKLLMDYELITQAKLRVRVFNLDNPRLFLQEKKYWDDFYRHFTQYLYQQRNCHDNYVGAVMKHIRTFFSYLKTEKCINTGEFYKRFYVCKEEIPVICLLPEQLKFLITDKEFDASLTASMQNAKAIFVFGCTVALRCSDSFAAKFTDIELRGTDCYLQVKTQKTKRLVRIKLPAYARNIVEVFQAKARTRKAIFPYRSVFNFNKAIKKIAFKAGWTHVVIKTRSKRGVDEEILYSSPGRSYRFCDLLSSHTMRRTAITTMLMLGMKEFVVKLISGHSANSKSFDRYVNLAQSYLDTEMDKAFYDMDMP